MENNFLKARKRRRINREYKKNIKYHKKEIGLEKKSTFNLAEVIVIMIMTLIIGGTFGYSVTYIGSKVTKDKKESISLPSEFSDFLTTYYDLMDTYYEDVDGSELINAGIEGMMEYLGDPYSTFLDNSETKSFTEQVEGNYVGIGSEISYNSDEKIIISNPFEGSPALEAGLTKGDIILEVNGVSTDKKTTTEVANMIKGKQGTVVKLKIQRGIEIFEKELTRNKIEIPSVSSKVFETNGKKIGYLKLSIFASNTYSQFYSKLKALENQNIDSLVIDVRDNSGGYLSSVTDIASLFLEEGKVIYQLETKGVKNPIKDTTERKTDYKISILINEGSASASEILAASLQESYNATVVGVNSYGKGTVQRTQTLKSGATIKYTIQKWLTPNGTWINEIGVTPNEKIELDQSYITNKTDESDNQLQKALSVLAN